MKNKLKISIDLENFEPISETSKSQLTGGFSNSVGNGGVVTAPGGVGPENTNCLGANCTMGCGDGQTVNTVRGCGVETWN